MNTTLPERIAIPNKFINLEPTGLYNILIRNYTKWEYINNDSNSIFPCKEGLSPKSKKSIKRFFMPAFIINTEWKYKPKNPPIGYVIILLNETMYNLIENYIYSYYNDFMSRGLIFQIYSYRTKQSKNFYYSINDCLIIDDDNFNILSDKFNLLNEMNVINCYKNINLIANDKNNRIINLY